MIPPTRQQVIAGLVALLLALAAIGAALHRQHAATTATQPSRSVSSSSAATFSSGSPTAVSRSLLVDVGGAVLRPGVYELPPGARVLDALHRAGGVRSQADITAVNRAALVVDGQQIIVPMQTLAAAGASVVDPGAAAAGTSAVKQPVSLNSGDVAAFDTLDGIGPVTAQKIVDDRAAHGPFRSIDDLDRVPGIGPATIEALRSQLTL